MDPRPLSNAPGLPQRAAAWLLVGASVLVPVCAQTAPQNGNSTRPALPVAEEGVRWQDMSAAQRVALKPLERDWSGIAADRKQKWLEVAARFPAMSPAERERVQVRMAEWAKMSPINRGQARLNYQQAKQVPVEDRQARWETYQALSPEQKHELAARAASKGASNVPARKVPATAAAARSDAGVADAPRPKSNIVPNPALAAPPKPIAPTVVRAQPGATTSLISSKPPAPPSHQQTGLPKIAATPQFVDKATLLPQRGPQAAAARPAATASAGQPRP